MKVYNHIYRNIRNLGSLLLTGISAFGLTGSLHAQGVYNSGATIYVESGASLFIPSSNGHFQNVNDGQVNNDGVIKLEGNWSNDANNGVFKSTNGSGWVILNGAQAQSIGGTEPTVFENIRFDNVTSGSAFTMDTDAEVEDSLDMVAGIVTTGTNTLIHSGTSASDLGNYGSTNFIDGNYRRYIASNTDTYVLPVGKGNTSGDYNPADFINASLQNVAFLNVSVGDITESGDNSDNLLAATQDGWIANDLKEQVVWNISPDAQPSGGSYGVNLYVQHLNGLTDNEFFVVKRPTGSNTYADWTTDESSTTVPADNANGRIVNGGNGYAQRLGFTSFSEFAVAMFAEDSATGPSDTLIFYNSFSPNDDGVNDVWQIRGIESYPNASVRIYNRWGRTVYYRADSYFGNEWDGSTETNDKQSSGAFFYLVDLNDGSETYKGTITIIK